MFVKYAGSLPNLERFNHRKVFTQAENGIVGHNIIDIGRKPRIWGAFWVAPPRGRDVDMPAIPKRGKPWECLFELPKPLVAVGESLFTGRVVVSPDGQVIDEFPEPVYEVDVHISINGEMGNTKKRMVIKHFENIYSTNIAPAVMDSKRLVIRTTDLNSLQNTVAQVVYPQHTRHTYHQTALVYKDLPIVDVIVSLEDSICLGKFFLWGRFMGYFFMRKNGCLVNPPVIDGKIAEYPSRIIDESRAIDGKDFRQNIQPSDSEIHFGAFQAFSEQWFKNRDEDSEQ